jgi:hypothetical protein
MKEEQSAIGMNFREQQRRKIALELEQTALKQVREEARKKGQQDWQNAQLSPKQEQEIKDVSAAYAAQADELRRVQEAYDLNKDVLKGIFTDLRSALADGKLSWEELGDVALNVLDKIINKIEDQLIDAILEASSAGGSSGGSGSILGWAVKGVGSLLGFSFHGGGTVGSGGNVAQFPHGAPYVGKFHGGGNFGGQRAKHDEVMALVQKQENIFTSDQTDRIIGTLQTNMGSMKERPSAQEVVVRGVFVDDNGVIKGRIERTSSAAVQSGLSHYDKGMPGRISDVMERHG